MLSKLSKTIRLIAKVLRYSSPVTFVPDSWLPSGLFPGCIDHAIKAVNAGFRYDADGYATEIDAFGHCFGTDDFKEGTSAFLEKRQADFPGS